MDRVATTCCAIPLKKIQRATIPAMDGGSGIAMLNEELEAAYTDFINRSSVWK